MVQLVAQRPLVEEVSVVVHLLWKRCLPPFTAYSHVCSIFTANVKPMGSMERKPDHNIKAVLWIMVA